MKYKDITIKSEVELRKELGELQNQSRELIVKLRLNQAKNSHHLRSLKKDIARFLTALNSIV